MVPVAMFLTMAEVISDNWLFSGLQAKESEKMDFLKTSGLELEILQDALMLDLIRKFLTAWAVMTICYLLKGLLGSPLYMVLVSYVFSVLGTFLARYIGTFGISIWIAQFATLSVMGCLFCVFFSELARYMSWFKRFFLVLGILISIFAVTKAMQKAIMVFIGILYKYYIIILCMTIFLAFSVQFLMQDIFYWNIWGQGMFSLAWTALIGFVLITVGAAIEYGISLLVYKTPVSKMAMGAGVRSQL